MDGGRGQQGRDRRMGGVHSAVRQDDVGDPVRDGLLGLSAYPLERLPEAGRAVGHREHRLDGRSGEAAVAEVPQQVDLPVGDYRVADLHYAAVLRRRDEQVVMDGPDVPGDRHGEFLADGVYRRVGDLREGLPEVIEEALRHR